MAATSAITLTAVLAGCSANSTAGATSDAAPTTGTVQVSTPEPTEAPADVVTAPNACTVVPEAEFATALSIPASPAPTTAAQTPTTAVNGQDAFGNFVNRTYCSLTINAAGRAALGMDATEDPGSEDVYLQVSAYNGASFSSSSGDWTDTDKASLIPSFISAHSERVGSNAVAKQISDTVVQDGSTAIVADDTYWAEVTLYQCHYEDCGAQAVRLAQVFGTHLD